MWTQFFESANPNCYTIYSHPKEPGEVTSALLKPAIISERIPTAYGDISLVRATRLLLSEAMRDPDNQYFLLLSESCIPLHSLPLVYRAVTSEPVSHLAWWASPGPESTLRWNSLPQGFVSRREFYKQHQWMILHRHAVEAILASDYTEQFSKMFVPDEHYFINALLRDGYPVETKIVSAVTTFVNWKEMELEDPVYDELRQLQYAKVIRPKTYHVLDPEVLKVACAMGCLFFRKVSPECDCSLVSESWAQER